MFSHRHACSVQNPEYGTHRGLRSRTQLGMDLLPDRRPDPYRPSELVCCLPQVSLFSKTREIGLPSSKNMSLHP